MMTMINMIGAMEMMIICDRQTDTDTLEWRRCSKTRKSRKTSNQMSTPVLIDILNIIIILIVLIIMMIIKGVCPMLRLSFCAMAVERFHMFLQEWTVVPLPPLHSEHFCKDVMIKSWTKLTNPQIYEERQMVHLSLQRFPICCLFFTPFCTCICITS